MNRIGTLAELEALYPDVSPRSLSKVTDRMTPLYARWIAASRFVVVSTVGPGGADGSPRGEDGPVVRIADDRTLLLPDWKGNNRLDTLRNIVEDGRIALMFMVPGSRNVVRVNGTALVTDDAELRAGFAKGAACPATISVVTIGEMYFQCAKAVMRAALWSRDDAEGLPSAGDFLREQESDFDGASYDENYPAYARDRLW